jgi:hypothetical protein
LAGPQRACLEELKPAATLRPRRRRSVASPALQRGSDAFISWKEIRTVDQRLQFLSSHQREEMPVTNLCHEPGISRPTAYKWIKRYDEVGPEGLLDLTRALHNSRTQLQPRSRTKSLHYGSDSPSGERGSSMRDWGA